ncbi:MAG: M28 family peptidase [Bacteroidia bacterium]|nr:M28 family peptidase [Bacteroidia bacterium]
MKNSLIITALIVLIFSCKKEAPIVVSLEDDVRLLASDSLKGRGTGTQGELDAANYIKSRMESLKLSPAGEDGAYFQSFTFAQERDPHKEIEYVGATDSTTTGTNVLGYIDNQAENTIIIGAHFDHLGMGGQGSLHRGEPAIHNGADDNASGVAVMLKLAKMLENTHTSNNYLFMAFSGEELGLLGSNYFAKNPTVSLDKVNYMLNMDMVGRLRADSTLSVSGTGTSNLWNQALNANNTSFKLVLKESGVGPSDHTSFYLQDIPVLHFFTGQHEDYHKPGDDYDKLNYEGMTKISDYIYSVIGDLDQSEKLNFKKTKNESEEVPRFKVGLGVIPDYLYDGKGMRIDGISEDKPAQKAGLQKGDIVIQLGDSLVTDMMSYMRALSSFEEGQSTEVVVTRDGEDIKVKITF